MKRILPRSVYLSVVGFVIVTMSVNPASGGWLLHKMRCGSHARHGAAHCQVTIPCQPVCCETPVYVDPCCGATMGSAPIMVQGEWPLGGAGCCGSDTVYSGEMIQGGEIIYDGEVIPEGTVSGDEQVMEAPATSTEPAPAADSEATEPEVSVESYESSSSDVVAPQTPAQPKTPEPAAPQPAAPAAPTTPAPAAPSTSPAPETTAPDNLFDQPAAPAPQPAAPAAEPAADDIFGEPATPAPAPAPAAPAAQPADDLFGEPAPAAPAEAPMDDLFGEPAAPAAAPAETAPADDIFGTPPAAEPPAPAAEPAAPAVEPAAPAAEPAKDALDDLFGSHGTPDSADPLANSQVRVWIDNTGEFSTEGRLIEVGSDYIRLLKTNGRTCTVPHSRLCSADVAYVAAIAVDTDDVKVAMAAR